MHLSVRPATEDDCKLIFDWANEPEVRNASFYTEKIEWPKHVSWFLQKLNDPNSLILIFEVDGLNAGQIRFDRNGEYFEIDYSIDINYRGKGLGKSIVSLGISKINSQFKKTIKILAKVKKGNSISAKVFRNLGFKELNLVNGDYEFKYE
ncbi:N-acetyltransferase [Leptospira kanakyensis]|uniref:N-acetyltransferase n=1 Tax=Leptospira kanakyensis TaxID=2484968 RepID=A0A6N4Q294_9LEPT|nr:GNAT family N-acetyltransferase [Leptospira kanakyensis]TGK51933.1 N-acetyltransferase [Leptospira kanakyensis]TGK57159.1 N-acetyltransferase [Leptospira kanakyensis]TGK71825.1 N-acetyltransferase [Leptospira kanakyensis]